MQRVLYDHPDKQRTDQYNLQMASILLNKALSFRECNPQRRSRFVDLSHVLLMNDPISAVKRVYKSLGWKLPPQSLKAMQVFLVENRHLKAALLSSPVTMATDDSSKGAEQAEGAGKDAGAGQAATHSNQRKTAVASPSTPGGAESSVPCNSMYTPDQHTALTPELRASQKFEDDLERSFHSYFRSKYFASHGGGGVVRSIVDKTINDAKGWWFSTAGGGRANTIGMSTRKNLFGLTKMKTQVVLTGSTGLLNLSGNPSRNKGGSGNGIIRQKTM